MTKNWAVVIGINEYNPINFRPLNYARQDAEKVSAFFQEMHFDEVYLFTETSPPIPLPNGIKVPSDPTCGNLVTFLEDRFKPGVLGVGDNCWFFFAGHGERHADKDYLMPRDANSRGTKVISGLLVDEVREWLTRSGAGTVIMLLDACRSEGSRDGRGIDVTEQKGVITISSCNPSQKAWEIKELEQGAFTYALLEGLQLPGERSCATVERLGNYLKSRVPELCRRYGKVPAQIPRISVDPIEKQHFILMPQFARQADIDLMKAEGFRLAFEGKLRLAEQIFIRANAVAQGKDYAIVRALTKVYQQMEASPTIFSDPKITEPEIARSPTAETIFISDVAEGAVSDSSSSHLPSFPFEVVRVNAQGKIIQRENKNAVYYTEDLGNGITFDMVKIPGGAFDMGSNDYDSEKPIHRVTVPDFYMGKFVVSQAVYEAIVGENPSRFKGGDRPVELVSWNDAIAFCKKLSDKTGTTYRLPSEAEWEYACRAGTTTKYSFGDAIAPELANYRESGIKQTSDVGNYHPNAFGLFDMHGNVWEWCLDHWHDNYKGSPNDGSAWTTGGNESLRLLRGGSWADNPTYCRSASRNRRSADYRYYFIGFRVVCSSPRTF